MSSRHTISVIPFQASVSNEHTWQESDWVTLQWSSSEKLTITKSNVTSNGYILQLSTHNFRCYDEIHTLLRCVELLNVATLNNDIFVKSDVHSDRRVSKNNICFDRRTVWCLLYKIICGLIALIKMFYDDERVKEIRIIINHCIVTTTLDDMTYRSSGGIQNAHRNWSNTWSLTIRGRTEVILLMKSIFDEINDDVSLMILPF